MAATPGVPPIDPRILFALWLYATLDGVGSGREVARLSQEHDAYRWICGGVSVNYHALNDFRSANEALMDELLTDNVAALAAAGAISLERVAQDGMRVRADAGAASFRRQASLQEHLSEAASWFARSRSRPRATPARPSGESRRPGCARPRIARNASAGRWSNCPKWPRPRSATAARQKTPGPAPPTPTRAS